MVSLEFRQSTWGCKGHSGSWDFAVYRQGHQWHGRLVYAFFDKCEHEVFLSERVFASDTPDGVRAKANQFIFAVERTPETLALFHDRVIFAEKQKRPEKREDAL